jgi:hypothetical protein
VAVERRCYAGAPLETATVQQPLAANASWVLMCFVSPLPHSFCTLRCTVLVQLQLVCLHLHQAGCVVTFCNLQCLTLHNWHGTPHYMTEHPCLASVVLTSIMLRHPVCPSVSSTPRPLVYVPPASLCACCSFVAGIRYMPNS